MSAITISREFGSVDDDFGESVARTLGYHCICKEEVATLLKRYGIIDFDREYEYRTGFWETFEALRGERRKDMLTMLNRVVQAEAQHGDVVIVGRSGYAILAGYADVLHVRLQAPLADRIRRVAAQEKITAGEAEAFVKERDRVRKAFVETFYGVPWDASASFDLVINTGKVTPERAATWVVDAEKARARTPTNGRPSARSIEVDAVLAREISDMLHCDAVHD